MARPSVTSRCPSSVRVIPSGSYPTEACGHGWVAIVWTTLSREVSMTETLLLFVLATNRVLSLAYNAVGCRPTSMLFAAAAGFARSMTLTVPDRVAPVNGLAGTCVL